MSWKLRDAGIGLWSGDGDTVPVTGLGRKTAPSAMPRGDQGNVMKLPEHPFLVTDWSSIPAAHHPGETGHATWRTVTMGDVRIRMVDYSPGYVADHWCDRGHVVLVLEGEVVSELQDGREYRMEVGMSYRVSDFGDSPHRSRTLSGCRLFIVD